MTEQVKKEIKKRKELNRQQRNEEKKNDLGKVQRTKDKIERTYKKKIRKHEEKIVEEIKQDNGGKEFWKNIRKVIGKKVKKKELRTYDEDGKELEEIEAEEKIERF